MIDHIEPTIGIPLAALLTLAWWLIERHHAHKPNHHTTTEGERP